MKRAVLVLAGLVLAVALLPERQLGCKDPGHDISPDGRWTLSVCTRPLFFAMPGQGGDAPAWIVLRDQAGAIRGVSGLDMVQNYAAGGEPAAWSADKVEIPLTLEMPLPADRGRVVAWLDDRLWRLRALIGWTTTNDDFH